MYCGILMSYFFILPGATKMDKYTDSVVLVDLMPQKKAASYQAIYTFYKYLPHLLYLYAIEDCSADVFGYSTRIKNE